MRKVRVEHLAAQPPTAHSETVVIIKWRLWPSFADSLATRSMLGIRLRCSLLKSGSKCRRTVTRPENTDVSQETPVGSRPVRGPAEATVRKSRSETEGHSELDAPETTQYLPDQVIYERAESTTNNQGGACIQRRDALCCCGSGSCLAQVLQVWGVPDIVKANSHSLSKAGAITPQVRN